MASRLITISVVRARGRPCGAARCVVRMESKTARAPMHEIECVERLVLYSLMRELLSYSYRGPFDDFIEFYRSIPE